MSPVNRNDRNDNTVAHLNNRSLQGHVNLDIELLLRLIPNIISALYLFLTTPSILH
jgi:hypothetical protein